MTQPITCRLTALTVLLLTVTTVRATTPPPITDTERAAIFDAAGFKAKGDQYIRCEEDPPTLSYRAGSIELSDLNKDGRPEAWVKEGSLFCYGHTAEFFVLLKQGSDGIWTKWIEDVGIPIEQITRHNGWPDIEVGGPGNGPFPIYRFDGKTYVRSR